VEQGDGADLAERPTTNVRLVPCPYRKFHLALARKDLRGLTEPACRPPNSPRLETAETCQIKDMVALALRLSEAGAGGGCSNCSRKRMFQASLGRPGCRQRQRVIVWAGFTSDGGTGNLLSCGGTRPLNETEVINLRRSRQPRSVSTPIRARKLDKPTRVAFDCNLLR